MNADREKIIREVAVLLARHDYRFGMGGNNETEYAFGVSYKFEKRATEIVDLIARLDTDERQIRAKSVRNTPARKKG